MPLSIQGVSFCYNNTHIATIASTFCMFLHTYYVYYVIVEWYKKFKIRECGLLKLVQLCRQYCNNAK